MKDLKPICPECHRGFRTESGLRWHLFHIHGWKETQEIIKAPSHYQLAQMAIEDEILLRTYAKGLGMDVDVLKRLIERRFGNKDD